MRIGPLVLAASILAVMLVVVPHAVASLRLSLADLRIGSGATTQNLAPVVIQPAATPTAQATLQPTPDYQVGAWMAHDVTANTGSDDILVSVSAGAGQLPVDGVSVTAAVTFTCASRANTYTYGPALTDSAGVADIPIQFAGLLSGQPVCVLITAHTLSGDISTSTAFVAA